MENSAVKMLFRSIMKAQQSPPRDLEIINLMYPVTMEELNNPVRNRGCKERSCIWPLDSLLKQAQQQARKGVLRQGDLLGSSFTCKMCSEETKFARRSFIDFYFDRKLDYLIRAAKIKYMETFTQEELNKNLKAKERAEKGFKQCKLIIHRGGAVMLEYKKKLSEGFKVTYHTLVFQDTANSSQQLCFNPKDYSKNLSALKIAQGLTEKSIGDRIDRGFETVSLCYSKKYQQKLERLLTDWILEHIKQHTQTKKREEVFSAKLATSKIFQARKNVELILFYPRYNLTQIYTFDKCEDILESCNNDGILICRLEDHRILIYTPDYSYIIRLEPISLKRTQIGLNREMEIKGQSGEGILKRNTNIQIKYVKQLESYHQCPKDYLKFASIRPTIENPLLIQNPKNPQEVYLVGGVVQGLSNYVVYRLKEKQWQQQKNQIQWEGNLLLSIIQGEQIFVLGLVEVLKTQKDQIYRLFLHQIEINKNQLKVTKIHNLCQTKSNHLLPLRTNQNNFMLVDLANKASPICLDISQRKIMEGTQLKEDITKFLRELYDSRNQKAILQSYPTCSVTYNQVTYNLLSNSFAKNTFKILYGCGNQWRISDLSQNLLRD